MKKIINKINTQLFSLTFLLIVHCTFNINDCLSQSQFQLSIGGAAGDEGRSIIQTTDGGYAIAGSTNSFGAGDRDFYIVKLDASGTLQWSRTIGGTGIEFAYSIIQSTDGGYAVAGITGIVNDFDIYIVKLDGSGTLQWSRTVSGTASNRAESIIQSTDGGFVAAGTINSGGAGAQDIYIVKLDGSGTLQWSKTVGRTATDFGYSIVQTTDGGYALAGAAFGAENHDFYIVKLDASGTLQWSRTVGGSSYEVPYSIIQTTDGGYALAGYTHSFGAGLDDMYIVKLDGSGTLQWSRTIGGTGDDRANSIIQTTDGGYVIAGATSSYGSGSGDMYIVKLDGSGTLQWSKTVGGTSNDFANSIIQTTDGGYAIAGGRSNNDVYIVKLDGSGNTCGNFTSPSSSSGTGGTLGSPTTTVISVTSTVPTPPSSSGSGGTVTVICTLVGIQPISNEVPHQFSLSQNYPNPFNPKTVIRFSIGIPSGQLAVNSFTSLKVYDLLGREVETLVNELLLPGTYEVDFDGTNYPSGVYFYKLFSGEFSETKKMLLVK